uniref:HEAT repeat domain-containing protein n=1 Tax=Steinernema glaseri TaxID=37863 RepID=A0A1I7YHH9_9BILA
TVPKKAVKAVTPLLIKHSCESDPEVREASYAALGALMKAIGEKAIAQFIGDVANDKLKMAKIQEFRDKAVVGSSDSAPHPEAARVGRRPSDSLLNRTFTKEK